VERRPLHAVERSIHPTAQKVLMNDRITRRRFVAGSVAFAGGALAFPAVSYARIRGANDRVGLGAIGVGSRGRDVLVHLLKDPATDVVALSDV
jgi:hypothetical protein